MKTSIHHVLSALALLGFAALSPSTAGAVNYDNTPLLPAVSAVPKLPGEGPLVAAEAKVSALEPDKAPVPAAIRGPKNAPNAIVSEAADADATDITIYSHEAQVQVTRTVHLKAGHNSVQLNGVASGYRPSTLRVLGATGPGQFQYHSATYQAPNLTPSSVLAKSIGKWLKLTGSNSAERGPFFGKLLSVDGAQAVIELTEADGGGTAVVNFSSVTLTEHESPKGLSNTASVIVEADTDKEGDYAVTFSYQTGGLNWSAKHTVVFDDQHSTFESWETSVSVTNDSGVSYPNATVRLTSGAQRDHGGGSEYRYAAVTNAMPAPGSGFGAAADAPVESVGDQKTFNIPGQVSLLAGQTRQISLVHAKDVPVTTEYFVPAAEYANNEQSSVSVRLKVSNCTKDNMGMVLPAGPVEIYQYNMAHVQVPTGAASLGDKAKDEAFDMVIGTASDIKYQRIVSTKKDSSAPAADARAQNGQVPATQTWAVKVTNFRQDRDVAVKVEVAFPAAQDVVVPLVKDSSTGKVSGTLTVPKGKSATLQYQYRTWVSSDN